MKLVHVESRVHNPLFLPLGLNRFRVPHLPHPHIIAISLYSTKPNKPSLVADSRVEGGVPRL